MKEIEHLLPILHQWAADSDFVQRLWVYGSRVPGGRRQPRPDSDLDVAIEVMGDGRENYYVRYFWDHKDWRESLDHLLPYRVHLTHYDPSVAPDFPIEHGNVKVEVDRYGYLVYDRIREDTGTLS